ALVIAIGIPVLALRSRLSPYAEGKTMAIASPMIVFLALLAVLLVAPRANAYLRWAARIGAAAILAFVIAGNAYSYRDVQLAPTARMESLAKVDQELGHAKGDVLLDDFEAFAKWFLRA